MIKYFLNITIILTVLLNLKAHAQVNSTDPFGLKPYELKEENIEQNQNNPVNVIPSLGRYLGRIAPGTERNLANPEVYSLMFTITGNIDSYVTCDAFINNEIDGVILENFIWEEYSFLNGFQPIGHSSQNGDFLNYVTQLKTVNYPNNIGVTQLRVYPQKIRALKNAATMKNINFTVTITVTYTGI